MTKLSFKIIKENPTLLAFPVISGLTMILILSIIFLGFWFVPDLMYAPAWMFFILGFFIYLILFYISFFFQAALVACAYATMEGESPGVGYGIRKASQRAGRIFMWALISAIIGMILQAIESRFPLASRIIGAGWSIATYFVVPIIVFEDLGAWPSVKRSWQVLKNSWGEALVGNVAVALIFILVTIPVFFLLMILAAMAPGMVLTIVVIIVMLAFLVLMAVLSAAVNGVLRTALYRYVTTGKLNMSLPSWFPPPETQYGQAPPETGGQYPPPIQY